MRASLLADPHIDLAHTLHELGVLHVKKRNAVLAHRILRQAIDMKRRLSATRTPTVVAKMTNTPLLQSPAETDDRELAASLHSSNTETVV